MHKYYRIDANRTPAFYKSMRVSSGVIFEICGVLIKFLLKKWNFGAKSGALFKFAQSVVLIKTGVLFESIQ